MDGNRTAAQTGLKPARIVGMGYWMLWVFPLAFLAVFYFFPLTSILQVSFSRAERGLLDPFIQILRSQSLRNILSFTIWQATLSTALTLLFGLPGAFLLARYRIRGKSLILAATGISFVLPTLVVATAFNALLGPRGWLNILLMSVFNLEQAPVQFVNTFTAILVAHVFYNTTIVLRLVGDFWSHLDPRLSQAAMILGANRWQILRDISLPLLLPAITSAALLIFIFDFTSFGVILILGGPRYATLEIEIYNQTINLFNLPLAGALALIQLGCTMGLTVCYTWLSARVSRPFALRPRRLTEQPLRTWSEKLLAGCYLTLLLGLLLLPLLALVSRSLVKVETQGGFPHTLQIQPSLEYYQALADNHRAAYFYAPPATAIAISFGFASLTVLFALVLGLPAAWALVRTGNHPANRVLEPLIMLPLGTSAVTLGLGFIVALDTPPLDLRASPMLIPLAHTLVAFPFVVRSLIPALRSIKPRLRQASRVLGASPLTALRTIELPLIGRALFVAAIFAFAISMGEFGATALISRPEYPTIPMMIYRYLGQPGALNLGMSLALSVILCLVTGLGMLAIERSRIADIGEF